MKLTIDSADEKRMAESLAIFKKSRQLTPDEIMALKLVHEEKQTIQEEVYGHVRR
jgi:hypothetical protein